MKGAMVVIKAIEVLGSLWFISPADSLEARLNLTDRPVNQSSTYHDSRFGVADASRAIDGNYDNNVFDRYCSHTDDPPGGHSWWRVDLGQPVKVQKVVIANRGDCCGYRMGNFVVGLSNSSLDPVRGDYALCGQYPGPATDGANLTLHCNPRTTSGRYVIVQQNINGEGGLVICEIEIYSGQVRNLNSWNRTSNQRLISIDPIVLSAQSAMKCIAKCKETVDCDSVNHHPLNDRCEMNFLPPGANGSHEVIEDGWDNWVQMYEFI